MAKSGILYLYVALLVYIVFFSGRSERISGLSLAEKKYLINIIPVKNEIILYKALNPNDPEEVFDYFANLFGNILLFIPYPFLMVSVLKIYKSKIIIVTSFLVSLAIEILQYIFRVGVADIDDVLLNTTGAIIGLLMFKVFIASRKPQRNTVTKN